MTLDDYKSLVQKRINEYKADMRRLAYLRTARNYLALNKRVFTEDYMQVIDDIDRIAKKWPR